MFSAVRVKENGFKLGAPLAQCSTVTSVRGEECFKVRYGAVYQEHKPSIHQASSLFPPRADPDTRASRDTSVSAHSKPIAVGGPTPIFMHLTRNRYASNR
jgi:hypothetical protein